MQTSGTPTAGGKKKSRFPQYAAAIVVNLPYVSFYTLGYRFTAEQEDEFDISPDHEGNMGLTYKVTGILSYALFAFLSQKLSRKTCIYIPCVGYIITCILYRCARSVEWLYLALVTQAISAASTAMMTVIYTSEIAHDDNRGALVMVGEIVFALTRSVAYSIHQFPRVSFHWFAILPSTFVIACFIFWLPESPVYFLRRGEKEAAEQSMLWLREGGSPEIVAQEVEKTEEMLRTTRSHFSSTTTVFQELLSTRSLKYTGIFLILYITCPFTAISGIYSILIWATATHNEWIHRILYFFAEFSAVLGSVIAFTVCDKRGRRFLLLISSIVCTVALIPLGICTHVMENAVFSSEEIFGIIFSIVYIFGYNIGIRTIVTVVLVDIFPPKILSMQLAFKGIVFIILHYVEYDLVYYNIWKPESHAWLFCLNAVMCLVGGFFIFKFIPETKQRPTGFLFVERREDVLLSNIEDHFT